MRSMFRRSLARVLTWGISTLIVTCYAGDTGGTAIREAQHAPATTCRQVGCGDDREAELRSEVALARAEQALARAEANRHQALGDELEAELAAARAALDKIPTERKLYLKIAASSISRGLELHGTRQFATGTRVETRLGLEGCKIAVTRATLRSKDAARAVWDAPTLEPGRRAAVEIATGTAIRVLTADGDDWTAKVPVRGAVVAIVTSDDQLIGVGELRRSTRALVDLLNQAIVSEHRKAAAANAEADAAEQRGAAAPSKLDYLNREQHGTCRDATADPTTEPAPASDPRSGDARCGNGDSVYLAYDRLSAVTEWDEGNACDTSGCGDPGAAEYCAIFGCDGGFGGGR